MIRLHMNHTSILRPRRLARRFLPIVGAIAFSFLGRGNSLHAADWMFEPSYYSHAHSPAYTIDLVPQTRSAYRQAYVNIAPHTRISGGWRWNNYQIHNGNSLDNTYMREFYIDNR